MYTQSEWNREYKSVYKRFVLTNSTAAYRCLESAKFNYIWTNGTTSRMCNQLENLHNYFCFVKKMKKNEWKKEIRLPQY